MLRRILILLLVALMFAGTAYAYREPIHVQHEELSGADGDPGQGDNSPLKDDDQYCFVLIQIWESNTGQFSFLILPSWLLPNSDDGDVCQRNPSERQH